MGCASSLRRRLALTESQTSVLTRLVDVGGGAEGVADVDSSGAGLFLGSGSGVAMLEGHTLLSLMMA